MDEVSVERDGPVTTVVLHRPQARNAVDGPTAQALADAFRAFDTDEDASVAVLYGAGGTFCAGADLKAHRDRAQQPGRGDRGRPDGPDADAARETGDRRDRGVRSRRGPRARPLVRPAGGRRGREAGRLLPTLGRPAHRRRDGAAAPAGRHRPGPGPGADRSRGRRRGGAPDRPGRPRRACRPGPRAGRGAGPRAQRTTAGLPARGPALRARAGGDGRGGGDAQRAAPRPRLACGPGRSTGVHGSRPARAGTAPERTTRACLSVGWMPAASGAAGTWETCQPRSGGDRGRRRRGSRAGARCRRPSPPRSSPAAGRPAPCGSARPSTPGGRRRPGTPVAADRSGAVRRRPGRHQRAEQRAEREGLGRRQRDGGRDAEGGSTRERVHTGSTRPARRGSVRMRDNARRVLVRLARRGHRAPRRDRLPRRPGDVDHGLPGRRAREAAARRGAGRRRQDRAGQGRLPRDRRRAGPAAVLRGARRGPRALRVELQEAAAAHPGVAGRRPTVGGDPRRHLHRRVPADPSAADRDPPRRADGAAHRRGRQDRRRGRGAAARGALRLPGHHPRARHAGRRTPALRRAHLQRDPGAVRGPQAALPLPAPRLPRRGARARDRALAGARPRGAGGRPAGRRPWPGCATSS